MAGLFFGAAPDLADPLRMLPSSLLSLSICSLIAAARLSWVIVGSNKFMVLVNIQNWWKSSPGQMLLAGNHEIVLFRLYADVRTAKEDRPQVLGKLYAGKPLG